MSQKEPINKWDLRFLKLAKFISTWSKDPSTQTGAVIVRPNKSICSVGFNGFPAAMIDREDYYDNRDEKYSRIIHCEMNAAKFATESLSGYTLYTYPFMSCDRCFVHMANYGITRFVAPKSPLDKEERWADAFDKVRNYAKEMDLELVEYDINLDG
jgi:dCMP deaminase